MTATALDGPTTKAARAYPARRLPADGWRWFALALVVVTYALFSSSTPDRLGPAELVIAAGLVAVVGIRATMTSVVARLDDGSFIHFSRLFFLVLLGLPTAVSLLFAGHDPADYARDLIALLFIFLFLLLEPHWRAQPQAWLQAIAYGVTFIGVAFSLRYFLETGADPRMIGQQVQFGDARYLPMDPAVTFAAAFGLLQAFQAVRDARLARALAWCSLAIVCVAPLAAMVVRAPLVLLAILILAQALIMPMRGLAGSLAKIAVLTGLVLAATILMPVADLIRTKFVDIGLAAKLAEMAHVGKLIAADPAIMLVGTGWGSLNDSPGYPAPVRFVHNFHAYMLLKAGVCGLAFAIVLTAAAYLRPAWQWIRSGLGTRANLPLAASTAGAGLVTLSSSLFLQPTFKSLSFGLVLTAMLLASSLMTDRHHG